MLDVSAVAAVVSHPQPLAQCAGYPAAAAAAGRDRTRELDRRGRSPVMEGGERIAALGPRRAAELYGATIVEENVADDAANATRFVWVARPGAAAPDAETPMRTSLTFWGQGDDEPGWLVRCLSEFAFRGVNLSKIESRPLRSTIGHYRFFVDCEGGLASTPVREAVAGLRAHCTDVRVLGSYPQERQVD